METGGVWNNTHSYCIILVRPTCASSLESVYNVIIKNQCDNKRGGLITDTATSVLQRKSMLGNCAIAPIITISPLHSASWAVTNLNIIFFICLRTRITLHTQQRWSSQSLRPFAQLSRGSANTNLILSVNWWDLFKRHLIQLEDGRHLQHLHVSWFPSSLTVSGWNIITSPGGAGSNTTPVNTYHVHPQNIALCTKKLCSNSHNVVVPMKEKGLSPNSMVLSVFGE